MNIAAAIGTRSAISTSMPANIDRPIDGAASSSAPCRSRSSSDRCARCRPACTSAITPASARPGRERRRRPTTSAGRGSSSSRRPPRTAKRADRRCARPAAPHHQRQQQRARRVEHGVRARRAASWVKKSTMMLPPCSWHHGRHSEIASAMPNCVSSTSPWIGRVDQRAPRRRWSARSSPEHAGHAPRRPGRRPRARRRSSVSMGRPSLGTDSAGLEAGARVDRAIRSLLVLDQQVARVLQHLLAVGSRACPCRRPTRRTAARWP